MQLPFLLESLTQIEPESFISGCLVKTIVEQVAAQVQLSGVFPSWIPAGC